MMPDREKVLEGLRHCATLGVESCNDCPYNTPDMRGCIRLFQSAIELLKAREYEPVIKTNVPTNISNGFGWSTCKTNWYACGACGKEIDTNDKFCRHCGRGVRWWDD